MLLKITFSALLNREVRGSHAKRSLQHVHRRSKRRVPASSLVPVRHAQSSRATLDARHMLSNASRTRLHLWSQSAPIDGHARVFSQLAISFRDKLVEFLVFVCKRSSAKLRRVLATCSHISNSSSTSCANYAFWKPIAIHLQAESA